MKRYLVIFMLFACFGFCIRPAVCQETAVKAVTPENLTIIDKALAELDAKNYILHDGIIVLPLLDENGKTTELGTFISILGMFRATYVPERIMNIYFPNIEQRYFENGLMKSGTEVTSKNIEDYKYRYRTEHLAEGSLLTEGGKSKVTLKFRGPLGEKTVVKEYTADRLHDIPMWIAQNIHEYMSIKLSDEQKKYFEIPEFTNTENLLKAAEMEKTFWIARPSQQMAEELLKKYEQLCVENPDSVLLTIRKANSAIRNFINPLEIIEPAMKKYPEHDRLKYFHAYELFQNGNSSAILSDILKLLERHYTSVYVYDWLEKILTSQNMDSEMEKVYAYLIKRAPKDHLAYSRRGNFYVSYAWKARGSGWASTVTEEGWEKCRERGTLAEKDLQMSFKLQPKQSYAPAKLINVALIVKQDADYVTELFDKAVAVEPDEPWNYSIMIYYLEPKWFGSKEEMIIFTDKCLKKLPVSAVAYTLLKNFDDWDTDQPSREKRITIYSDTFTWKKLKSMFTRYLNEKPESCDVRNLLAKYAVENKDYDFAFKQFNAIETNRYAKLWNADAFHKARKETLKALNPALTHEEFVRDTINAYNKRIDSDANDIDALIELACFHIIEDNYYMAVPLLLKAEKMDITNTNIQATLGYIYYKLDKYKEAISMLQKAIMNYSYFSDREESFSNNQNYDGSALSSYAIMSQCYEESGHLEKAIETVDKGLTLSSAEECVGNDTDYWRYAHLYKLGGHFCEQLNQFDKAIRCFEDSQKLSADSYNLTYLGEIYEKKGDVEKAIDCYKKALSLQNEGNKQRWEITTAKERLQALTNR